MRPLRVLHCIASLDARDGGPARSVPALAEAEAINGADVVVWSRQQPTINLSDFRNTRFVSGEIRSAIGTDQAPDVIHDHGLWLPSNHMAARAGRHRRIPRIVSPRGMLEPWCLRHRRLRKQVAWRLYQHRDLASSCCLHATSDSESRQFRTLGFHQPIISLPNGVTVPKSHEFGAQHPPDEGAREVLFLSRIHPVKGLLNLTEAWKQFADPQWRLKIVGSGEDGHLAEVQQKVRSLNLQHRIEFHEAVHSNRKWELLQQASVVVLPSFSENFGNCGC